MSLLTKLWLAACMLLMVYPLAYVLILGIYTPWWYMLMLSLAYGIRFPEEWWL